jgi:hypothetical protein
MPGDALPPIRGVTLTTIYLTPTRFGEYFAVHSRHLWIGGPIVSQLVGTCTRWFSRYEKEN